MSKIIIGIHGLRNKPSRRILTRWWKRALREGLKHAGHPRRFFRFKLVYWADVLHPRPLNPRARNPEHPLFIASPYSPAKHAATPKSTDLRKKMLDALEKQLDTIFLNDDGSLNFSGISDLIIRRYFEDLNAYYAKAIRSRHGNEIAVKDIIRDRLARTLRKHRKKNILLIAHSMGSIIAYDVLTQNASDVQIDTLVTIGSPLGMPAIISKALSEQNHKRKKPPTPDNVLKRWINLSDLEDKVALNYNLGDDYRANKKDVKPVDMQVVNDYEINGKRNPHKSYGYLRVPEMAETIHHFLKH